MARYLKFRSRLEHALNTVAGSFDWMAELDVEFVGMADTTGRNIAVGKDGSRGQTGFKVNVSGGVVTITDFYMDITFFPLTTPYVVSGRTQFLMTGENTTKRVTVAVGGTTLVDSAGANTTQFSFKRLFSDASGGFGSAGIDFYGLKVWNLAGTTLLHHYSPDDSGTGSILFDIVGGGNANLSAEFATDGTQWGGTASATVPVITVNEPDQTIYVGETAPIYTAVTNDGSAVAIVGTTDTATEGDYIYTFNASNIVGPAIEVTRTTTVIAAAIPIITVNEPNQTITVNEPYTEYTFSTNDGSPVTMVGSTDNTTVGTYPYTFNASNIGGNAVEVTRTTTVNPAPTDSNLFLTMNNMPDGISNTIVLGLPNHTELFKGNIEWVSGGASLALIDVPPFTNVVYYVIEAPNCGLGVGVTE